MKKFILLFSCLYSFLSFSQTTFSNEFRFSTGVPVKSEYSGIMGYKMNEYIFDGNKHIISVKFLNTKINVQRHEIETLKEVSSNTYQDLPEDSRILTILRTKNTLTLFYMSQTAAGTILSARSVNNNDGTLLPPVKCVESAGKVAYFQIYKSLDESKILIQYRKQPVSRNDNTNIDVLGFYSFTANLEKISGTEVKMPFTESIFKVKNYMITNSGAIYLLAMNAETNKIDLREIIGNETKKLPTEDLDSTFSMLKFNSVTMSENSKGNLTCNGFYMNGIDVKYKMVGAGGSLSTDENINGLFYFEISTTGKLIHKTIYEFPITLVNQNESNKTKNFNEKNEKSDYAGISNLKITNAVENADGSILVTGTQSKFNGILNIALGHIIIYKIDNAGNLSWIIKIPRNQIAASYFRYEFDLYQHENNVYILFADVDKNMNINQIDSPKLYSETTDSRNLIAYKIDFTSGKYIRKALIDINNVNGINCEYYFLYNYVLINPTEMVREIGAGKEKSVFIKMKLNR